MIALGVIAAVWLTGRRMAERGYDPEGAQAIAVVAVPAGLIGARLYHVITDWPRFEGRWLDAFKIWEGGLGVLGGIAAGVLGALWVMRRRNLPPATMLDIAAPALALAQAIGRWGNWFNQELYGKPTDLPWGLEIDPEHRVEGYADVETFHATFLYESLWNFALVAFLLWLDKRRVLRPGRLFAVYVAGYSLGRLWIEALRIDTASEVLGARVNLWVFGVVLIISLGFVITGRRSSGDPFADGDFDTDPDGEAASAEADDDGDEADPDDEDAAGSAADEGAPEHEDEPAGPAR